MLTETYRIERAPTGPQPTACQLCHAPIPPGTGYVVRTWRTDSMPAPAFEYSCLACGSAILSRIMLDLTEDDGTRETCSLRDFLQANEDDAETCAVVGALQPGQPVNLGGGACPLVTVTRVAK